MEIGPHNDNQKNVGVTELKRERCMLRAEQQSGHEFSLLDDANVRWPGLFTAGKVAAVVKSEQTFQDILESLECLGFEVACSDSLEDTFEVVSVDPEEWALVIVRLDQPFDIERIESFVRIMRMMGSRVPVLIFSRSTFHKTNSNYIKTINDCTMFEPKGIDELRNSIIWAVQCDANWGAQY